MIEEHPLEPFLPSHATLLMLGSFPPQKKRWSMDFFYPNLQNDMWRIFGLLFFNKKEEFLLPGGKAFNKEYLIEFLTEKGIALYDTASSIRRLQDNASDKFLEVVTATDLDSLLCRIPQCRAIVTTGQKATDVILERYGCDEPPVGGMSRFILPTDGRTVDFWRMPSSSRAYPLALEKKAENYRTMFINEHIL